jgi:hypothetical protein
MKRALALVDVVLPVRFAGDTAEALRLKSSIGSR